jgi:hypothetical protein
LFWFLTKNTDRNKKEKEYTLLAFSVSLFSFFPVYPLFVHSQLTPLSPSHCSAQYLHARTTAQLLTAHSLAGSR